MEKGRPIDRTYLSIIGLLKRAAAGIVPPKEVEDIVQEAYVRACQAERESPITAPRAFLFKTVKNLALDNVKRAETRLSDSFDEDEAGPELLVYGADPLNEASSHEEFSLFCEAVRLLPTQCRRAFVLKKVYGCSRREIAERMGISENTVQTHIARGMKACMQFMEQTEREGTVDKVVELQSRRLPSIRKSQDDLA
ncbi:RNA polymerase sigma factor [Pseudomonadales bacterium]|jgi:RNA polymerase sigma-70 factor (ECF subfamily)|nr:RNA polymerase sigma factor [Gammaproteobacteria bacterium]MDA7755356.1 RNA polymerase sigma factor [Pseudomonadales bacterium]MDB2449559.1 RNA polymerase sigma factor [Pseudomonadales bacterium]MDC6450356.1 RNA polymerase sigma factor [Pseudomonadales bacterium]